MTAPILMVSVAAAAVVSVPPAAVVSVGAAVVSVGAAVVAVVAAVVSVVVPPQAATSTERASSTTMSTARDNRFLHDEPLPFFLTTSTRDRDTRQVSRLAKPPPGCRPS